MVVLVHIQSIRVRNSNRNGIAKNLYKLIGGGHKVNTMESQNTVLSRENNIEIRCLEPKILSGLHI